MHPFLRPQTFLFFIQLWFRHSRNLAYQIPNASIVPHYTLLRGDKQACLHCFHPPPLVAKEEISSRRWSLLLYFFARSARWLTPIPTVETTGYLRPVTTSLKVLFQWRNENSESGRGWILPMKLISTHKIGLLRRKDATGMWRLEGEREKGNNLGAAFSLITI